MAAKKPNRKKKAPNKWIQIEFYWEEDKEKYRKDPEGFTHRAMAQIGVWNEEEDEDDMATFYYFDDEAHLKLAMDPERRQEEFIVTKWEYIK